MMPDWRTVLSRRRGGSKQLALLTVQVGVAAAMVAVTAAVAAVVAAAAVMRGRAWEDCAL